MTDVKIPAGSVVLNVLHVVEYMAPDGQIYKQDFSHDATGDGDLELGKSFELIEWARAFTTTSMLMEMVHDYCHCEDDGEDEVDA